MKKRIIHVLILLSVCIAMLLSLTSCKDTSVLEQIIYKDNLKQVDPNTQEVDNNSQNTKEDQSLFAKKNTSDSKQKRNQSKDSAVKGNGNAKADTVVKLNTDSSSKQKSQSSGSSDSQNDAGDAFDNAKSSNGASSDTNVGNGNTPGDNAVSNPRKDNVISVTDANGTTVKVPENVDTVTAVGEAGVMVEMLGGSDRLIGTSESVTDNSLAQKVFNDMDSVKNWWSGTGTDGIKSPEFSALLKADPDVCLVINGQDTFSEAQLKKLKSKKIPVVTLYSLNTSSNIKSTVTLIGKILGTGDSKQKNPEKLASAYVKWYDQELGKINGKRFTDYKLTDYDNDVVSGSGDVKHLNSQGSTGLYSLFIKYWDTTADVGIYSNNNIGKVASWSGGAPATDSGYSESPLSYYMSVAGVVNSAAAEAAKENLKKQYTWYVNGWLNTQCVVEISDTDGQFDSYTASDTSDGPYLAQVRTKDQSNTKLNAVHLGSDSFNKVIVANKTIKEKLAESKLLKSYGIQHDGNYDYYGFDYKNGLRMESSVVGSYTTVVNPYGVGCWYEGSAESPLEAVWVAYEFGTDNISIDTLKNEIRNFYSKFYGYSLSDRQMSSILNGSYAQ